MEFGKKDFTRFEPSVPSVNDLVGGLAQESLFKPFSVSVCCTTNESRVREDRRKRSRIEPPQFIEERFSEKGELIGFDGSQAIGREEILEHLKPIFANHPTPPFISKVKEIRMLGTDFAILRAIVGMIPHGKSDLVPELNAHQTLVAVKKDNEWRIELFQNTPAQFHGRPELVEQMTEELRELLN